MPNIKEICSHINSFSIIANYNNFSKNFSDEFFFDGDIELTKKEYYSYLKLLSNHYTERKTQLMLLEEFLNQNQVISITTNDDFMRANEDNVIIKNLIVELENNKKINISFPDFNYSYLPYLCDIIDDNRRNNIINTYLTKQIDNIIIYPSHKISEMKYYAEIKEEQLKNIIACFNYNSNLSDEKFMLNGDIIYEILEDFCSSNTNEIEAYYEDDKKIVINFSNNKKIIIYDKDLIKEINPLIRRIQNQLIENKLNVNSKRKVLKYERNNNGKNGKSM